MHDSFPAEQRVDIHTSRTKQVLAILVSAAFLGIGVLVWLDDGDLSDRGWIVKYVCTPFCALLLVVFVVVFVRHRPVLTLTPGGARLPALGVFLPWSIVADVTVEKRRPGPYSWVTYDILVFRTAGAAVQEKGWSDLMTRWTASSWMGEPYSVTMSSTSMDKDELLATIERFRAGAC